jgi:hypothetical protein
MIQPKLFEFASKSPIACLKQPNHFRDKNKDADTSASNNIILIDVDEADTTTPCKQDSNRSIPISTSINSVIEISSDDGKE